MKRLNEFPAFNLLNDLLDRRICTVEAGTSQRRILGVDYGSQRIGLSLSDPLGIIAKPIEAIKNTENLFTDIQRLSEKKRVQLIVVGMPLNLKGQYSQKTEEVQEFIRSLRSHIDIEVVTWDERFTTTIAKQSMFTMGMKKKERRMRDGRVDSMAAAIMLQGFLDRTNRSRA